MNDIDHIITLLDFSAQIGADVTIKKEQIPVLLKALEPVIKERAEYWQAFYARFKPFNVGKRDPAERGGQKMKFDNLKRCPFCSSIAQTVVDNETEELFIIQCTACKAQTAEYENFEDARRAWNRRYDDCTGGDAIKAEKEGRE